MRRLTPALALLRVTGVAALGLLLWNPVVRHDLPGGDRPLILLDASLSMTGASWRAALDTARVLARESHGVIWRFGDRVTAFDSSPPLGGASRLGPALDAAAARGGSVIVVTDGSVGDAGDLPADVRARARVIIIRAPDVFDAFIASVSGPRRLTMGDTLDLEVTMGTAGRRDSGGERRATLAVSLSGRRLASRQVTLPDSGTTSTALTIPVSRFPTPGWSALEVRLEGVGDAEPRDDARLFVVQVSAQPAAVVVAAPPDWESRFLALALGEVARVPLKLFVETEPGHWRDGGTLAPVPAAAVARATAGAQLVALLGDPARLGALRTGGGLLAFVGREGREGDWYVDPPPPSPLAASLAGVAWDSLPPVAAVADLPADSAAVPVLTARLARRGASHPIVTLSERGGQRRVTVAAAGLWRWAFRGGASEQAYRSLVATLADLLLSERGAAGAERVVPETYEVPNGLPLSWRWAGGGAPADAVVTLNNGARERTDTLRFDAGGRAELRLPAGAYRYAVRGRGGGGKGRRRTRRGRGVFRRVAAGRPLAARAAGAGRRAARVGGAAGPVVALRARDRGVRRRVGLAAAAGVAVVGLWTRLARVFSRTDAAAREEAERILLEADFGPAATEELLERMAREPAAARAAALERAVAELLAAGASGEPGQLAIAATPPTVILIFGVNGVGKTTTAAKLARRLQAEGRRVLLAAADTFRAGAALQLQIWAERLGAPWVGPAAGGADPAAVAFDALQAARARGYDTVLVDTAGRLHTEERLLEELKKVVRVVGRQHAGAPHESLLVLDATVGQNAVQQAQRFAAAVPLTGLIVTKLDGTARGGGVVALRRAVPVPIRFLGTGEALDDLAVFDATRYARRLVSE